MSLTNPNTPVSQQDLQDFYHKILPYMGGSSEGGGHTIEDAEGTDLTQRDTLQFGEGFKAEDDSTNEKTVITPDVMQSGDMSDVITPLPTVQPRYQKYSTEEQIVGEWIDGKPVYQKTVEINNPATNWSAITLVNEAVSNAHKVDAQFERSGVYNSEFFNSTSDFVACGIFCGSTLDCRIQQAGNSGITKAIITIQYTKTTD